MNGRINRPTANYAIPGQTTGLCSSSSLCLPRRNAKSVYCCHSSQGVDQLRKLSHDPHTEDRGVCSQDMRANHSPPQRVPGSGHCITGLLKVYTVGHIQEVQPGGLSFYSKSSTRGCKIAMVLVEALACRRSQQPRVYSFSRRKRPAALKLR